YGGTVEKFIGDAVMAVWGAPTAHEDDAERAVRSALDLVSAVQSMGAEIDAPLSLRAGVLTGEAAVTVGATNQGMVAGDLVNTASRLQSAAPPGTVLVGEATRQAASEAIAFEPAGEQLLKGKATPVPAFRALRVVAQRGGVGRSEQLEAPFVGRGPELRMLKDFHAATGAERRPRLVSIIGQGGIGKSRLVWEFLKYIDGVTEVVYWHQGRSPAYGDGISFWALAEMVRSRATITEADDPVAARTKLAATLDEYVRDDAERRWMEPPLLQLLGLDTSEATERPDRESLFAAWRIFFERIAEHGVVILVFEDLQWADDGLLDFIDHVLEWTRDRPIYLIGLARPELLDRRPGWGAGRRAFTSLVLEPLTADEMRQMLAGLVPGLPPGAVDRIIDRAEGIPLYAIETVRMLLATGELILDGGAARPTGDLTDLSVPPSLQALIASRLDALDADDRSLLQAASVIGKIFSVDALSAVSGRPADEVTQHLRALVRREMLSVDGNPRSPELGQYGFVQALVREVAYGTLSRRDRRRLHLAAARYFEMLEDEGIAGALAEHYLSAYRAQPDGPEGEAVAAQARVALRGAAERARALGSFSQAVRFLERALEVTTHPDEQRQLHAAAGEAGVLANLAPELPLVHTARALELAREGGDGRHIMDALTGHALALGASGHSAEAAALLEPARDEYRALSETREYVRLVAMLARATMLRGEGPAALHMIDETLPTAEHLQLNRETVDMLVTRGALLAGLGRVREGVATLVGAVASAESYELTDVGLRGRINLSYAAAPEDPLMAFAVAREGVEIVNRLGMRGYAGYMLGNATDRAQEIGEWEWAEHALRDALVEGDPDPTVRFRWAVLRGARGEEVEAELAAIRQEAAELTEIQVQATLDEGAADVALAQGNFTRALELARRSYQHLIAPDSSSLRTAMRAAAWTGSAEILAEVEQRLAEQPGRAPAASRREAQAALAALAGRRAEAASGFAEAMRRWRELGLDVTAAWCAIDWITMLGAGDPAARAAADEARETLERVRSPALLALLDAAVEAQPSPAGGARSPVAEAPAARR
ncbi:MAG TPA: AAA family ATPase, partial [Candidatus Limnocylindria bacterium]|nr:AAA family ATPase [Candidatus Limnocylindria bacterium]